MERISFYEARIAFDVSTSVDEITNDVRVCNIDGNETKNKNVKAVRYAIVKLTTDALIVKNVNCWTESLNNAKVITKVAQAEKYLRMRFGKHLASINMISATESPANVFAKPTR